MSVVDTVLAIAGAEADAHVHEVGGNNLGPRVEQYLASVGLGGGQPWCAAFVSWCLRQAGVTVEPFTGDTWTIEDWARSKGELFNADLARPQAPQRGDVFLLLSASTGRPTHTGFVEYVSSNGTFGSIEGNTGGSSDTDGDGVFRKTRAARDCEFARWSDLVPALPSPPAPIPAPPAVKPMAVSAALIDATGKQVPIAHLRLELEIGLADGHKLKVFAHD